MVCFREWDRGERHIYTDRDRSIVVLTSPPKKGRLLSMARGKVVDQFNSGSWDRTQTENKRAEVDRECPLCLLCLIWEFGVEQGNPAFAQRPSHEVSYTHPPLTKIPSKFVFLFCFVFAFFFSFVTLTRVLCNFDSKLQNYTTWVWFFMLWSCTDAKLLRHKLISQVYAANQFSGEDGPENCSKDWNLTILTNGICTQIRISPWKWNS